MKEVAIDILFCSCMFSSAWLMKEIIDETNRRLVSCDKLPLKTLVYNGMYFTLFFLNQRALIQAIKKD